MTIYRDLTANVTAPRTKLDRCAVAVLDHLSVHVGRRVDSADLKVAIDTAGADRGYLAAAIKALRNMGYPIVATKARHLSWYKLAAAGAEYEDHRQHVVQEGYSRVVTVCRELAGAVTAQPADLSISAAHKHAQLLALALGTDTAVGKTIPEVIADVVPL